MSDPCTCSKCNAKQNRIEAYGAIRRVLTLVRHHEREYRIQGDYPVGIEHAVRGNAMRRALRAAIGLAECRYWIGGMPRNVGTIALERGTSTLWSCANCGSTIYVTRATKPAGPCPVCTTNTWTRQRSGTAGFHFNDEPDNAQDES